MGNCVFSLKLVANGRQKVYPAFIGCNKDRHHPQTYLLNHYSDWS